MPNPFGGFTITSPLSSKPHNSQHDLSSNCIRDNFGPTCQTVADTLLSKGPSTFSQLLQKIRQRCRRDVNSERLKLVRSMEPLRKGSHPARLNLARGSEENGFIVDAKAVRAALIVLMQHSLVKAVPPSNANSNSNANANGTDGVKCRYKYSLDYDRAILIQRYPLYIEYSKKIYKEEGESIAEEISTKGRMGTMEVIRAVVVIWENTYDVDVDVAEKDDVDRDPSTNNGDGDGDAKGEEESAAPTAADKLQKARQIANVLKSMVQDGFIEIVLPVNKSKNANHTMDTGDSSSSNDDAGDTSTGSATATVSDSNAFEKGLKSMLKEQPFQKAFQPGAVWRLNVHMYHASMRAIYLGQLVSERYGQVKFSGAIVSAALKYVASKEYSLAYRKMYSTEEERQQALELKTVFSPKDILNFLPPPVLAEMSSRAGGATANLTAALTEMANFVYPPVIEEIEEGQGHSEGGKFEVTTRQLLSYLKGRIVHQVVKDHFGDVGARICSILEARGHLEGEAVAENAMVPAKDAREMLHRLYKANYISMLYLQQSKQHNPANAMYLWCVEKKRLHANVSNNVCRALVNLRLRRQHEVEEGKDWIERAKLAGDTDENESATDKLNYNKFCRGLERLDNACLQLDETLMIMKDFDG